MEFSKVVYEWNRMCEYINTTGKGCVAKRCPLADNGVCGGIGEGELSVKDIQEAEKLIIKWAAEHPEPLYPRWIHYLQDIGVLTEGTASEIKNITTQLDRRMDKETAEKLGVPPELYNLTNLIDLEG